MNRRNALVLLGAVACGSTVAPVPPPGPDEPRSIVIAGPTTYLVVGATLQLSADVRDSANAPLPDAGIRWSVDQPAIATVSSLGSVRAISTGQARITAVSGDAAARVVINVMPVPDEGPAFIVLSRASDTLMVGDSVNLSATVQSARHVTLPEATVTWRSDNPAVASMSNGMVRAVTPGKATITAQSGVASASYTVVSSSFLRLSVSGPPPWRGSQPVIVGGSVALLVDVRTTAGVVVPNAVVSWTSANPAIATVSSSGVVHGTGVGTTMITAVSGRARDSLVVISDMPSLLIGPTAQLNVAVGDSVRLTVTARLPQGDVSIDPGLVQWSTSQPQHVRVNAAGWAIGQGVTLPGEEEGSMLTATYNGMTGEFEVLAAPFAAGLPAGMRYVHAAGDLGTLTFNSSKIAPVQLMSGEVRDVTATSGNFQVGVSGFPVDTSTSGQPSFFTINRSVIDILPPNAHVSLYAVGDSRGAIVTTVWDNHGPISGDSVLVRLMYASNYSATYAGNNLYFMTAGSAIDPHPYTCYIDQPGEITGYFSRPAGSYDIVLVDPGGFVPDPEVFGRELVRFHVNPTPGRATTYAITGLTPQTMRLVTVLDP